MLTTFVIGLREGLEASLIVVIIAAFLTRNAERRSVRLMWIGVAAAVGLCLALAAGLQAFNQTLQPGAQQMMEGILALVAVAGVTYMIVWMRRHSRTLRSDLEDRARDALARRSALALVGMAFLAVIREGIETAVFLMATLGQASSALMGAAGAVLGVAVAVAIGYGIYRGGVRIDLGRFFKITGVLLVVVAAGLVSTAVHEFTEAGLLAVGTSPALDLTWLVKPGTIRAGLLTGFLGLQPVPTYAEAIAWMAFALPMVWYVAQRRRGRMAVARLA